MIHPHKIDKSSFGPGPWHTEPDRLEWRYKGLPCLIVRNRMGTLCGYVGLPAGHPWCELGSYFDIPASVHGGLTYGPEPCTPDAPICHTPLAGESDDVRWIGFDCGHPGDVTPSTASWAEAGFTTDDEATYKDTAYVRAEVDRLADQVLSAVEECA